MYPCRAGPENLQSRAVAAEPEGITEFSSPAFYNPPVPTRFLEASLREKRAKPSPLPLRFEVVSGSLGGAVGTACIEHPPPSQPPPQALAGQAWHLRSS